MRGHFAGDITDHAKRWSALWDKGDFLPWDRGMPNPALEDTLTDRSNLLGSPFIAHSSGSKQRKRALVPGCGKGYDVLLLASFGYDAFGLEVSETAVKRCNEEQKVNGHRYPVKNAKFGAGKVSFTCGDFFAKECGMQVEGDGKFNLIYDYTVRFTPLATTKSCLTSCPSSSRPSHQACVRTGPFKCQSFWHWMGN